MIVLDASATCFAFLDEGTTGDRCRAAMHADSQWIVPEHWLIEVLSVIRGNLIGGKISMVHATDAATAAAQMNPVVAPTRMIADRIWELRGNLTAYDAAYVATAENHGPGARSSQCRIKWTTSVVTSEVGPAPE